MDSQAIFSLVRTWAWDQSASTLPDSLLVIFENIAYHEIENAIVSQVNEDFFYDEWKANTVIWQREYSLPVKSWTIAGLKKLLWVSVKYKSTDTEYTKLIGTRLSNLEKDLAYYVDNQDTNSPFFIIADKSVFIYPDPTEAVTDGIMLYGVNNLGDLTASSNETAIKIPIEHHQVIALGMMPHVFRRLRLLNEKNDAIIDYKNAMDVMLAELTNRNASPIEAEMPDISSIS